MYRKVRDRSSYAFALISVAAALATSDGVVTDIRMRWAASLTAVAGSRSRARPAWRACRRQRVQNAADVELAAARPTKENGFKIELAKRIIVSVLRDLTEHGSAR